MRIISVATQRNSLIPRVLSLPDTLVSSSRQLSKRLELSGMSVSLPHTLIGLMQ